MTGHYGTGRDEGDKTEKTPGVIAVYGEEEVDVMMSSDIQCAYCGLKGKIEGFEFESSSRDVKIFKHCGHNPFSGHLHYQCPSCSIILLVLPMDLLDGKSLTGLPNPAAQNDSPRAILPNLVDKLSEFRKVIQTRLFASMQN
jgi:hypothetical protein